MKLFLYLFAFSFFLRPEHAFYVSITDIAYTENNQELEVQIKIFADDLEDDIRSSQNKLVKLQDGVNEAEAAIVHQYLLDKVEILLDGKAPEIGMHSCKLEGDAIFSVYKGKLVTKPKVVEVSNTVLIDLFPTQSNIIRLKGKAAQGLLKLDKKNTSGFLPF